MIFVIFYTDKISCHLATWLGLGQRGGGGGGRIGSGYAALTNCLGIIEPTQEAQACTIRGLF
jgi:hypothetical protein